MLAHMVTRVLLAGWLSVGAAPWLGAVEAERLQPPNVVQAVDTLSPRQAEALATAARLHAVADSLAAAVKAVEALTVASQAVTVLEREFGREHRVVAPALVRVAERHGQLGQWARAVPLLERVRRMQPRLLASDDPIALVAALRLGEALRRLEELPRAEPLLAATVRQLEQRNARRAAAASVPDDSGALWLAATLGQLAELHRVKGEFAAADSEFTRAAALYEMHAPASDPHAGVLHDHGLLALDLADVDRAEQLLQRARRTYVALHGEEHERVARSLNGLARLRMREGAFPEALRLAQQSLRLYERRLGPSDPRLIPALASIADAYSAFGDWPRAQAVLNRAVALAEDASLPPTEAGELLESLGMLHASGGDWGGAEEFYRRAIKYRERTLGPDHPLVARMRAHMGGLYRGAGDMASAEWLFRRALADLERALGPDHAALTDALIGLAQTQVARRRYDEAERLDQRALDISRRAFGDAHPTTVVTYYNLLDLSVRRGDADAVIRWLTASHDARERLMTLMLGGGAERHRRLFLMWDVGVAHALVGMHLRSRDPDPRLAPLALTMMLQSKGRAQDATADVMATLHEQLGPEDRPLLDSLIRIRTRISALAWSQAADSARSQRFGDWQLRAERLESELSHRSAALRARRQPVTLEELRRVLPEGGVLVEFLTYRPYNLQARWMGENFGRERYAAYVVARDGPVRGVDLGEARDIDEVVRRFRTTLANPRRTDVRAAARALDAKIMQPVRPLIGDARALLIAPDGQLNLIPFAALVDQQGRYLLEHYAITHLTSGRDLLRLEERQAPRRTALIIAGPTFDRAAAPPEATAVAAASVAEPTTRGRPAAALRDMTWGPLPGATAEARALGEVLAGAAMLTGADATEAALKQARAPGILHVATHGFFLPPPRPAGNVPQHDLAGGIGDQPLLRAGLALAGANAREGGGGEDGILTALEASALNLWGTELVVLSACETGVGDVANGEGVFGLRRAIVLAGARSLIMSLWKVDDVATRDLMVELYRRLAAGEGRGEALRRAQLGMLETPDREHPYYWAAFVHTGDWRPLAQTAAPPGGAVGRLDDTHGARRRAGDM